MEKVGETVRLGVPGVSVSVRVRHSCLTPLKCLCPRIRGDHAAEMLFDIPSLSKSVSLSSTPGAHRTPSLSLSAHPLVTHGVDFVGGGVGVLGVAEGVVVVFVFGVVVVGEVGVIAGVVCIPWWRA